MGFESLACQRHLQVKIFKLVFFKLDCKILVISKNYRQSLGLDEIFLPFYVMTSQNIIPVLVGQCTFLSFKLYLSKSLSGITAQGTSKMRNCYKSCLLN